MLVTLRKMHLLDFAGTDHFGKILSLDLQAFQE